MGEQSIQALRAAVARTKQELDEAEHAQAKVESDLVIAKGRLTDVANRMSAGTLVAEDLVSVAERVKELEAARAQTEGRIEAARDAHTEARDDMEEAKNSADDELEAGSTLRMFEDREANASTESAKAYARAGRDLCRAALLVNASPAASLAHCGQTVVALLQNALQAYVRLGLPDVEESRVSAGVLLVPADAKLEPRGTSYGGKEKYQWQTDAIHRGMSGKAYVQLYLNG